MKEIAFRYSQMSKMPFGYIEVGNTASKKMNEKFSFTTIHPQKVAWMILNALEGSNSKL